MLLSWLLEVLITYFKLPIFRDPARARQPLTPVRLIMPVRFMGVYVRGLRLKVGCNGGVCGYAMMMTMEKKNKKKEHEKMGFVSCWV